jgi:hypothetical protein
MNDIIHASVPTISYECRLGNDNRSWSHGTVIMVVRLRILATIECRDLLPCLLCSCIRQCAKPCCITVVIKAKETAVMKASETTLCIHGSAKQSVSGGGRGSSNKSNPATARNGKASVWYQKHWRPVNHTSYPIKMYESA